MTKIDIISGFLGAGKTTLIKKLLKEALAGKDVKIIVDCGIASGADVYKAIALGADAAAVGRSMLPYLEKDGVTGVEKFLQSVSDELRFIMSCTGFSKVADIDDSCLYFQS